MEHINSNGCQTYLEFNNLTNPHFYKTVLKTQFMNDFTEETMEFLFELSRQAVNYELKKNDNLYISLTKNYISCEKRICQLKLHLQDTKTRQNDEIYKLQKSISKKDELLRKLNKKPIILDRLSENAISDKIETPNGR